MDGRDRKVALITGANRGIGFETARQLGQKGITVLVGTRSEDEGSEAASKLQDEGLEAQSILIDLDAPFSFEEVAKWIEDNHGRLDILINDAGIHIDEKDQEGAFVQASGTSPEVLRKTFDTNFFHPIALTQRMLPLIRKSDAGRIVFVSSVSGSLTEHSDPLAQIYDSKVMAYDSSKTAVNSFVVHLAHELRGTGIKVNAAHPGSVITDMNPHGKMPVEEGARTSVDLATLPADGFTGRFMHLGREVPW